MKNGAEPPASMAPRRSLRVLEHRGCVLRKRLTVRDHEFNMVLGTIVLHGGVNVRPQRHELRLRRLAELGLGQSIEVHGADRR